MKDFPEYDTILTSIKVEGIVVTFLAICATSLAYYLGLLFDASQGNGEFMLRILLPILTMGAFILEAIKRKKN